MSLAVRAEWTKPRTAASTGWLPAGVVVVTVVVSATVDAAGICTSSAGCHPDVTRLSLTGTDVGQAVVAIGVVLGLLYIFPILGQILEAGRPLAPLRNAKRRPFGEVVHRGRW